MLIFKKEKRVVKLCSGHADKVLECAEVTAAAIRRYCMGQPAESRIDGEQVGRMETEADELRREIGDTLFDGAYLPQIREDLFRLIQSVDTVANKSEDAWEFFATESPQIPDGYGAALVEATDAMMVAVRALHGTLKIYFKPKGKMKRVREESVAVSKAESALDDIEWKLTQRLFASELELATKQHLKKALTVICRVADCAEDAADEVNVASMKSVV